MDSRDIFNAKQGGTQDLATSLYPEIDETVLAGPVHSYQHNFTAPMANMTSKLHIETGVKMMNAFTPFITTMQHDFYCERFALSPKDRPSFFAGDHYSDKFALSPPPVQRKYSMNFARSAAKPVARPTHEPKPQAVILAAHAQRVGEPSKPSYRTQELKIQEATSQAAPVPRQNRVERGKAQARKGTESAKMNDQPGDSRVQARKEIEEIQGISHEAIAASVTEATPRRSNRWRNTRRPMEPSSDLEKETIETEPRRPPRARKAKVHLKSLPKLEGETVEVETESRRSVRPREPKSYDESWSDLDTTVFESPRSRKRKHQPDEEVQGKSYKSRRTGRTVKAVNYAD